MLKNNSRYKNVQHKKCIFYNWYFITNILRSIIRTQFKLAMPYLILNTVPDNYASPRWHFCTRLRSMYRKLRMHHMIDNCLTSLQLPLSWNTQKTKVAIYSQWSITCYIWIFSKLLLKWVQKCHFGTGIIIQHRVIIFLKHWQARKEKIYCKQCNIVYDWKNSKEH